MTDISIEIDSEKCKKCDNCTANQVCKDTCACKRTCENPDLVCDLQTCKPGCACPDKTVWNGEKCVPKYECPCKHNNTFYDQGEKWSVSECMKCKCTNNTAVCGETCTKTCSTVSQCDPLHTFHFACRLGIVLYFILNISGF